MRYFCTRSHGRITASIPAVLVTTLVANLCGCGVPTAAEPTASAAAQTPSSQIVRVTVGPPQRKSLTLTTTQPGRIEPFQETPLFSKMTGYVETLHVDIGDAVTKDQVLIDLRIPEMQDELEQKRAAVLLADAEVKQAEAAVESARAMVQSAEAKVSHAEAGIGRAQGAYERWKSEHARLQELADRGSVNPKLVDETLNELRAAEASQQEAAAAVLSAKANQREAEAMVVKAEADVAAAQAKRRVDETEVARAQTLLNYAQIRSPFDGIVTRRHVDAGHYVHPASGSGQSPLLVVASQSRVRVSVDIPEMEAPRVNTGDQADVAVVRVQSLDREFEGLVSRSSWSLDPTNRSLRVEVDLQNADGSLRPGMHATVHLQLEQRDDVLTLPILAILREGRETFCHCVVAGVIERRPVVLGLRSGDEVEVVSGVDENDRVVLKGAAALAPGQSVVAIGDAQ